MHSTNTTLDRFIDSVESLPPAPHVLPDLLEALGRADTDSSRLVELITFEQSLTADVLRLCNSPRLRGDEPVRDLPNAVTRLGLQEISRLVACIVGHGILGTAQQGYGLAQGDLWRHSAVAAVAGRTIARDLHVDESLAFTASLLHDLGKLVLSAALERTYAQVVQETERAGHSFLETEEAILGVNHADAGGRLLERWHFPAALVESTRHHHDPLRAPTHAQLAIVVHVADLIAHLLGHGYGHHAYAIRAHPEALDRLEYRERDVERLVLATQSALTEEPLSLTR